MMVSEKRLCSSAKISHTVLCNISLYRDTKEVIYRYTQNVYCYVASLIIIYNNNKSIFSLFDIQSSINSIILYNYAANLYTGTLHNTL